jgi:beta-lactamase class A
VQRQARLIAGAVVVVVGVLLALLVWQVINWRASLSVLPQGTTVAGLDVGELEIDQALANVEAALSQEVEVTYQDEVLRLSPQNVEFRFDPEGTRAAIEEAVSDRHGLNGFLAFLLRRTAEPPALPASASYSEQQLDAFLARVSQQYDRPSQPPVPLNEYLTFRAGRPGYQLDHEASQREMADALLSAVEREAELVAQVEAAPPPEMDQLAEMLNIALADFVGIPSVFVKDLQTGAELEINPDVAYAGMSVLKIAVMLEAYRALDGSPNITQTQLLTWTITESENHTANALLRDVIGGGDAYQGAENLTVSMAYLGLVNTFMATPYDEEVLSFSTVTPANTDEVFDTQPDPFMQTTAGDVGLLLEMIYHCSQGGGTLMVAYPGDFTPQECQQMLDLLAANRIDSLIEVGLPPDTPIAHKQGLIPDTHADAGIVMSPNGDFVLVIFLYYPTWLDWELSNATMADVASATYSFFNPTE